MSDFFPGQGRVRRCRQHAQNFSAPRACREMAFPLRCFVWPERLLRIGGNDLGVGARARAMRIHPVKRLAHAPRKYFFALPHFGFICIF
jgi:hypothetical protein